MTTIYKNFDFNPVSSFTSNANYTVPQGRYGALTSLGPTVNTALGTLGANSSTTIIFPAMAFNGNMINGSDLSFNFGSLFGQTVTVIFSQVIANLKGVLRLTNQFVNNNPNGSWQALVNGSWTTIQFANGVGFNVFLSINLNNVAGFRYVTGSFTTDNGFFTLTTAKEAGSTLWIKEGDVIAPASSLFHLAEYNIYK